LNFEIGLFKPVQETLHMDVAGPSQKLQRITTLASLLALCTIVLGAYVRLSNAGLGCPDWPACFGQLIAPSNAMQINSAQAAFPGVALHPDKAWLEMIHRYVAATLGVLVVALFYVSWRERSRHSGIPVLPSLLLMLVIAQGLLGMLTVTEQLKPVVVTMHLIGGMTTLTLLVCLLLQQAHWRLLEKQAPERRMAVFNDNGKKLLAAAALTVLFLQIMLGGWTSANAAGLICTDFPTCQGAWVPSMDFASGFDLRRSAVEMSRVVELPALTAIHWTHRLGAVITSIMLAALFFATSKSRITRMPAYAMLWLLAVQVSLGIANVLLGKPVQLAVMHNAIAATLLITVVTVNYRLWVGEKLESFI
jgi:cytochrome c oxidase assembly protein subunit 15